MHFKACRAHAGGGLRITQAGTVHHGGSLAFEACHASSGGGLYLKEGQGQFAKLLLDACDADMAAGAFAAVAANGAEAEVEIEDRDSPATCLLKIGSAHLSTESSESSGIYISEEVMNCTSTFYANATTTRSAAFLCPLGTGAVDFQALNDFGCLACKPGDTQVLNVTRRPCSQCPEGAFKCLASELKMESGLMVELEDVNRSFHCPNEAACPGGDVSQGRVRKAMCQDGYRGQGCASCRDEYAIADSSVFSCTACSKDRRVQAVQWITFLSQRTFLFALGALSALGAKNDD
ncbi:pmpB [Symbiodinium sp. KB8]|nr:pmpB [Symbiodinium sp. KB8]